MAGDLLDAPRPALVTVPNVELLEVGTWATSTGVFTWTQDDLVAAVAAYDDPGYTTPVLKLGHTDPRFDGEPALGRIINPRLSTDGMTLIADLAGVPAWLADVMASAFPRRSIEGEFGHRTQTGTSHQFALTALALLGVQAPAVSTLADVAALYGLDPTAVAASAARSLHPEEPMPTAVQVAASVNLDKVRQSFYGSDLSTKLGAWSWVREVYNDAVIIDDDEGSLYRVPWAEAADAPGEVTWGEATKVRVEYVEIPADAGADDKKAAATRGTMRARLAAMAKNSPAAEPAKVKEIRMSLTEDIRQRLGVPDDADDAAVLTALDEKLRPAGPPVTAPPGVVTVDAAAWQEMQDAAKDGRTARQQQLRDERERELDAAVKAGKFPPARREHWQGYWDRDPDGAKQALASLAPGLVPVDPAGYAGGEEATSDAAVYAALFGTEAAR